MFLKNWIFLLKLVGEGRNYEFRTFRVLLYKSYFTNKLFFIFRFFLACKSYLNLFPNISIMFFKSFKTASLINNWRNSKFKEIILYGRFYIIEIIRFMLHINGFGKTTVLFITNYNNSYNFFFLFESFIKDFSEVIFTLLFLSKVMIQYSYITVLALGTYWIITNTFGKYFF